MATINETIDAIEACRTCGIYYMTTSNYLKPLFQSPVDQPEMMLIRLELAQWKVEVGENDGYPQYVCITCIHEFQKVFKFRTSCIETQEQFRHFYSIREENRANIKIKTELQDPDEEKPQCDFIYVDELSDTEYDGATPFNIPHVPIKEELIEAATIPMEESLESINMVESASSVVNHTVPSSSAAAIKSQIIVQNDSLNKVPSADVTMLQEEHIECKLCQHLSPNREEHKQHMQRAHEIRDLECHICGKQFKNSTSSRLKFHIKWHNLSKHVKCTQCGFVCNSKEALREHKWANHIKMNCKICRKGVLAKKMKSHLREHEVLTKYPCEYCTEAFSSDNEREKHIWQIHAREDINENPTSNQVIVQDAPETQLTAEEEDELLREDEPELQDDIIIFKFFCAHCDEKFRQQIDLEMHVKQEHRSQQQLTTADMETININHDLITANNIPTSQQEQRISSIAVFQDYDDENHSNELQQGPDNSYNNEKSLEEIPTENCDSHFMNPENFTKPPKNTRNQHDKDKDHDQSLTNEYYEVQTESQHVQSNESHSPPLEVSDISSVTTKSDEVVQEETTDTYFSSSSVNNDLLPFACAKCTKTFATIEQLRIHHEQHITDSNRERQTNSKAKFKCHICNKAFDLKFSLNRHIKKHKHTPF